MVDFRTAVLTAIFARRETGTSPSGAALTPIILGPGQIVQGGCSFIISERTKYAYVIAVYMDRASGDRVEVKVECDSEGEGDYTLDQPLASKSEATSAAKAKAKQMQRRSFTFSADIVGDPAARGGAPVAFAGVRGGVDGREFVIDTAVHEFSAGGGYTTNLSGQLKV